MVFLGASAFTFSTWRWTVAEETEAARRNFEHASQATIQRLETRFQAFTQVLSAAGGFHAASGSITRKGWNEFFGRQDILRTHPGLLAIAYSPRIAAADLPRFVAGYGAEGLAGIKLFPPGTRPYYQPVGYAFPETPPNLRALGYDLATQPAIGKAMDRARDGNIIVMSGKTALELDDKAGQAVLLLFHPLYRGAGTPLPALRSERHSGFVVAVFNLGEFMSANYAAEESGMFELRVSDAEQPPGPASVMFDSNAGFERAGRLFHFEDRMVFGGHAWHVRFDSTPGFEAEIDHTRSTLILKGGIAAALLLGLLAWLLADSHARVLRRAEEINADLSASEERFRRLSALSSDWFWEQDSEFRFTDLPRNQSKKGGLPAERVLGLQRWDLPIKLSPEEWAAHRALLEAHQPFRDFEYRIEGDGGPDDLRWISISGEPRFDSKGRFMGYSGVGKNVTERRRAEEELKRHRTRLQELVDERTADLLSATRAAESANQAKSEFLANMSHELRTPMHSILSFARIGIDKVGTASPEKISGYFERIRLSGERLMTLINDLLDLSKLEAGKMILEKQPYDLAEILHGVMSEFEAIVETKSITLLLEPVVGSTTAMVDAESIAQVMRNLLSNAIKFTPGGRTIRMRIEQAEQRGRRATDTQLVPALRLIVADEGIGIPEGELERVFEKFAQSSLTRTGAGGTGLGLSISREIVNAHRGSIRAYNNAQVGATFEMLLPRGL